MASNEIVELLSKDNIFTVTDGNVYRLYGGLFNGCAKNRLFITEPGEKSKTVATFESICAAMLASGCGRQTLVLAVGGGVVGDLAGFAAACFMRGVDYINIPTTLLAMVDSAFGGKTGVNLPQAKNAVGAFHKPLKTVTDTDFLSTLDGREFRCGMGETVKTALLNKDIFSFVENNIDKLLKRDKAAVDKAVKLCSEFKKKITEADFTEKGLRKILNVGHTVGHALETKFNYSLSHGEFVLHGIRAECALKKDLIDADYYVRIIRLTDAVLGAEKLEYGMKEILTLAAFDKKNAGGKICFMLPVAIGEVKEVFL